MLEKRIWSCFVLSCFFIFNGFAQEQLGASVTIAWDQNPETDIAGYRLHWSRQSRTVITTYENIVEAGNVTVKTLTNLPYNTQLYLAATAHNTAGLESLYSDELPLVTEPFVPDAPPSPTVSGLKLKTENGETTVSLDLEGGAIGKKYTLQTSTDLQNWTDAAEVTIAEANEINPFSFVWPEAEAPTRMFFRFKWQQ